MSKSIDIELEDGIMIVTYNKQHITASMVDDAIKRKKEMFGKKNYPQLSDVRNIKSFSREARIRLIQKDGGENIVKVALLIGSSIQKTIYTFFNVIYSSPMPSKIFVNRNKAIKWLKE